MVVWLILLGVLGCALTGAVADFRGRLAYKLQLAGGLVGGSCFALAAFLLAFHEPWTPTLILDKAPQHGSSALIALIVQAAIYAGPQLTALALASLAYYILSGMWALYVMRFR